MTIPGGGGGGAAQGCAIYIYLCMYYLLSMFMNLLLGGDPSSLPGAGGEPPQPAPHDDGRHLEGDHGGGQGPPGARGATGLRVRPRRAADKGFRAGEHRGRHRLRRRDESLKAKISILDLFHWIYI